MASFVVAHLFLLPLPLMVGAAMVVAWAGPASWLGGGLLAAGVAYALTYAYGADRTGARMASNAFHSWWLGCHPYFPVRLLAWSAPDGCYREPCEGHRATFATGARSYVFGVHPHGAIPLGGALLRPQLSRLPWVSQATLFGAATAVFALPLVRDFYLAFGSVRADRRTLQGLLSRGRSVVLLPGGIREQLLVCPPQVERIVLAERTGFVRLALEHGAALVPIFVFGERRAYRTNHFLTQFVSPLLKAACNIGVPCVRGRWGTLMPFPGPVTIVVGKPLDATPPPRDAVVSDDVVAAVLARYIAALRELYLEHRVACGYGDVELVIE